MILPISRSLQRKQNAISSSGSKILFRSAFGASWSSNSSYSGGTSSPKPDSVEKISVRNLSRCGAIISLISSLFVSEASFS